MFSPCHALSYPWTRGHPHKTDSQRQTAQFEPIKTLTSDIPTSRSSLYNQSSVVDIISSKSLQQSEEKKKETQTYQLSGAAILFLGSRDLYVPHFGRGFGGSADLAKRGSLPKGFCLFCFVQISQFGWPEIPLGCCPGVGRTFLRVVNSFEVGSGKMGCVQLR